MHIELQYQICNYMDIVSRLKQYLDLCQVSVTQFADACGIPRPSVSQLLNGRNKKVSDEVIAKIHAAYPDLSMMWLMFGEGNMATGSNIKTSEAQIEEKTPLQRPHEPESQPAAQHIDFTERNREVKPEIFFEDSRGDFDSNGSSEFTFEPAPAENPFPWSSSTPPQPDTPRQQLRSDTTPQPIPPSESQRQSITLNPGKGKRVVSIIVYYDDNSFEPFIPDPLGRNPFSR